jgi:iron complex outermembrane receptor protein
MKLAGKWFGLWGAVFAITLAAPFVWADEADEEGQSAAPEATVPEAETVERPTGIEEIVVTSRKREERIQDVPISITAIDEARLEQLQTRDLSELTYLVPSMGISRTNITPNGLNLFIRGNGSGEVEKTADPGVLVSVDGVARGTMMGTALDTFDMERIEVLRGPQGTLYGRNTIGGAINITRTRPTGEFGGKMSYTAGKFDRSDYKAIVNFPSFWDEQLSVKLGWMKFSDSGYLKSRFYGDTGPAVDRESYSLTLLYEPTENMNWVFTFEKFRDRSDGEWYASHGVKAGVLDPPPPGSVTSLDRAAGDYACNFFDYCNWPNPKFDSVDSDMGRQDGGRQHADVDGVTIQGTWDTTLPFLGDVTLDSVTGWMDAEEMVSFDWDGSPYTVTHSKRPQDRRQLTQELRISGSALDERLQYTGGLYYFWTDNESRHFLQLELCSLLGAGAQCAPGQFGPLLSLVTGLPASLFWPTHHPFTGELLPVCPDGNPCNNIIYPRHEGKGDTHAEALFLHMTYDILPNLTLTLGGRYTREEKKFTGKAGAAINGLGREEAQYLTPFTESATDTETWREFTPKYGLDWRVTDDLLAYVSWSKGFRSGAYNGRNSTPETIGPADPEFLKSWEFGIKSDWLDNRLRVNVAYFDNEYIDKHEGVILLHPQLGTLTVVNNAASATIKGWEAEVTVQPVDWIRIGGTYSYTDGEYDEFFARLVISQPVTDNSHLPFPGITPYSFSAFANTTFMVGPGELSLYYQYTMAGNPEYDPTWDVRSHVELKPRHNVTATYSFDWGDQSYTVSAFLRNIQNIRHANPAALTPLGGFGVAPRPREWGLEIGMSF